MLILNNPEPPALGAACDSWLLRALDLQRKEYIMLNMNRFLTDERGMETVEWAVVAALIVAGLVAVITGLGNNVVSKFTGLQQATS